MDVGIIIICLNSLVQVDKPEQGACSVCVGVEVGGQGGWGVMSMCGVMSMWWCECVIGWNCKFIPSSKVILVVHFFLSCSSL